MYILKLFLFLLQNKGKNKVTILIPFLLITEFRSKGRDESLTNFYLFNKGYDFNNIG